MLKEGYNKRALDVLITRQTELKGGKNIRALHLLITGKCNNKCIFCFSRRELLNLNFEQKDIKKIIKNEYKLGARILVLSGGEPTIHPDYIEFIKYAKEVGYGHIKTITNGRMFAYNKFVKKAKKAGLDEAVISIHSHLSIIQDELSGVKGSFDQALRGIKNCQANKIGVKINLVINKKNVKKVKETLSFFSKEMKIKRIGFLRLMPFGQAWKNKDFLYYNKKNSKYLIDAFDFAKKNKIEIWSNRFDLNLFKNYPEFMQHPYKFVNEVESRIKEFTKLTKDGKEMYCYPKRCKYCFLEDFCKKIHEANKNIVKGKIKKIDLEYLDKKKLIDPIKYSKFYVKKKFPKIMNDFERIKNPYFLKK